MYSSSEIRQALESVNVRAFLRCIRHGESNQDDSAYQLINGGGRFTSFARHPYAGLSTRIGGKAAGAYQFLPSTWGDVAARYPADCPDFSPASQDFGAVAKIADRAGIPPLLAGDFEGAVLACQKEWTSLPGASESAPGSTMKAYKAIYLQYGGQIGSATQPPAPVEEKSQEMTPPPPKSEMKGTSVPLVLALMPVLAQLIPQLANVFKPGQDATARVTAAAQVVSDAVTTATGSPNLQAAIEQMQADPAARKLATDAVNAVWFQVTEVGGGLQAARRMASDVNQVAPWKNVSVIITVMLLPAVYLVTYAVLFLPGYSEQLKTVVVTAIVMGLLGGITGFFYGTSLSSSKKDDTIAAQAGQPTGAN